MYTVCMYTYLQGKQNCKWLCKVETRHNTWTKVLVKFVGMEKVLCIDCGRERKLRNLPYFTSYMEILQILSKYRLIFLASEN